MSWNLSTNLKNQLLGDAPGTNKHVLYAKQFAGSLTFTDGGTGDDYIADTGSGMITFNTYAGYTLNLYNSTNNDEFSFIIESATAPNLYVPTGQTWTAGADGNTIILVVTQGGSFQDIMRNSYLDLYNGSRPASADLIESGTKLVRISRNGTTFTPGAAAGGINFGPAASGAIGLQRDPTTNTTAVLSGEGLVTGSALSGRLYENADTAGASTTYARMDGRVSTSNAEINMAAGTTVTDGVDVDVTSLSFSI